MDDTMCLLPCRVSVIVPVRKPTVRAYRPRLRFSTGRLNSAAFRVLAKRIIRLANPSTEINHIARMWAPYRASLPVQTPVALLTALHCIALLRYEQYEHCSEHLVPAGCDNFHTDLKAIERELLHFSTVRYLVQTGALRLILSRQTVPGANSNRAFLALRRRINAAKEHC